MNRRNIFKTGKSWEEASSESNNVVNSTPIIEETNEELAKAISRSFNIEWTKNTPEISYNQKENTLSIIWKSFPENAKEWRWPIQKKLTEGIKENTLDKDNLKTLQVELESFNTASCKCLFDTFKLLKEGIPSLKVEWFYEEDDEDMLEAGEDYASMLTGLAWKNIEKID